MRVIRNSLLAATAIYGTSAAADVIPTVPDSCVDTMIEENFCSKTEAPATYGPVSVTFYGMVSKEDFATPEDIHKRFRDYPAWIDYVAFSESDAIDIQYSMDAGSFIEKGPDGKDVEVSKHYFDYVSQAPVIKVMHVRGVEYGKEVKPVTGALKSWRFEMFTKDHEVPKGLPPLGSEHNGLRSHFTSIHIGECTDGRFCEPDYFYVVYDAVVEPNIRLLPRLTAPYIKRSIEAVFFGMLFGDAAETATLRPPGN